ncbi:hypothetical protein CI109_107396 [Kwoniella shandongensis]|uniref:Uncharacterized protein n=1 Tax=Kwoniella shandongensis TaxID=1734106 RepID=A0A5M6BXK1_9TREE|nr:uncharacterized protein CI109_004676 [Kwoniella shandongensis]KAA5526900.1 hypothetical protein CI109_004676 [Kwoniella shandongensis]
MIKAAEGDKRRRGEEQKVDRDDDRKRIKLRGDGATDITTPLIGMTRGIPPPSSLPVEQSDMWARTRPSAITLVQAIPSQITPPFESYTDHTSPTKTDHLVLRVQVLESTLVNMKDKVARLREDNKHLRQTIVANEAEHNVDRCREVRTRMTPPEEDGEDASRPDMLDSLETMVQGQREEIERLWSFIESFVGRERSIKQVTVESKNEVTMIQESSTPTDSSVTNSERKTYLAQLWRERTSPPAGYASRPQKQPVTTTLSDKISCNRSNDSSTKVQNVNDVTFCPPTLHMDLVLNSPSSSFVSFNSHDDRWTHDLSISPPAFELVKTPSTNSSEPNEPSSLSRKVGTSNPDVSDPETTKSSIIIPTGPRRHERSMSYKKEYLPPSLLPPKATRMWSPDLVPTRDGGNKSQQVIESLRQQLFDKTKLVNRLMSERAAFLEQTESDKSTGANGSGQSTSSSVPRTDSATASTEKETQMKKEISAVKENEKKLKMEVIDLRTKLETVTKKLDAKQKETGKVGNELGATKKELKKYKEKVNEKEKEVLKLEDDVRELRRMLAARW